MSPEFRPMPCEIGACGHCANGDCRHCQFIKCSTPIAWPVAYITDNKGLATWNAARQVWLKGRDTGWTCPCHASGHGTTGWQPRLFEVA